MAEQQGTGTARPGLGAAHRRGGLLLAGLAETRPGKKIGSGRQRDRAVRAVAEPLAIKEGVPVFKIIEDAALAVAVDAIAEACGEEARRFLLDGPHRLKPDVVRRISNCHPERQRHEIAQARLGRPVFAKPQGDVPIYDTLGWHEVVSRLARAKGNLAKQSNILAKHEPPEDRRERLDRHARAALEAGRAIARAKRLRLLVVDAAVYVAAPSTMPDWGKVVAGIGSAAALVAKNARDIPRMPEGMVPTEAERVRVRGLLSDIRHHAAMILRSLAGGRRG